MFDQSVNDYIFHLDHQPRIRLEELTLVVEAVAGAFVLDEDAGCVGAFVLEVTDFVVVLDEVAGEL